MNRGRALLRNAGFVLFLVAAPFVLVDCLDAGGPSFVTLGVTVEPAPAMLGGLGGTSSAPQQVAQLCVRLPVLLGSTIEKEKSVADGLSVALEATRDSATVTFPGATDGDAERSFALDELRRGVRETLALSVDTDAYAATIASGCTNP
jgi:hypothetical protein